jgi:hypothetical protein
MAPHGLKYLHFLLGLIMALALLLLHHNILSLIIALALRLLLLSPIMALAFHHLIFIMLALLLLLHHLLGPLQGPLQGPLHHLLGPIAI